jgi:hypothetical protein
MISLLLSICNSLGSMFVLLWMLRLTRTSLGIPFAYLFLLLLIHVPGALAHLLSDGVLTDSDLTERGMIYATTGAICFVIGVGIARFRRVHVVQQPQPADRFSFALFCVLGGWLFTYGLGPVREIPTLGAMIDRGEAAWMLGIMLGLRAAVIRRDYKWVVIWLTALAVYPTLMLLLGGFLSYGSTAVVIVLSILAISTKSNWRVVAGIVAGAVLAFNLFLSYFQNRDDIREAVWGGATIEERIDATMGIARDLEWFDPSNEVHLFALDQRLNQNYFVGLSAMRIEQGQVDYVYGRSLWEGLMALVPRAVWPDKPVFGGSPAIVSEMTGLTLSDSSSFGVGNVMEFYVNFGFAGVVIGFLVLGLAIGWLDRAAAIAEATGRLGQVFIYFLPAIALIQPNGSIVELVGGVGAAWGIAYLWRFVWGQWTMTGVYRRRLRSLHAKAEAAASRHAAHGHAR